MSANYPISENRAACADLDAASNQYLRDQLDPKIDKIDINAAESGMFFRGFLYALPIISLFWIVAFRLIYRLL